jgi:hypothetical protein
MRADLAGGDHPVVVDAGAGHERDLFDVCIERGRQTPVTLRSTANVCAAAATAAMRKCPGVVRIDGTTSFRNWSGREADRLPEDHDNVTMRHSSGNVGL